MRPLGYILIASLALNAAVLVKYFSRPPASGVPGGVRSNGKAGEQSGDTAASPVRTSAQLEADARANGVSAKSWETLRGTDIKGMVARLRAAGFPDSVIRAIIYAEINERYRDQQLAIRQKMKADTYWSNNQRMKMDAAMLAENRALNAERNALSKSLLSELGADDSPMAEAYRRRQYGNIPPEKIRQMESVINDYNELRGEIYTSAQGVMLAEDREKLAFIEREQKQDLAQLLTPAEREEYEVRSSPLSNQLRSRFNSFEPTEAEFRAIYAASKATEGGETGTFGATTSAQARQQEAAIANALRNTLTPERFAEFQRLSDNDYASANRVTTRLNLPASTASELVSIQKESQRLAREVRSNAQMSADQKSAQLALLGQQAVQQLTSTLGGDRGLAAYRENAGGWLQEFAPRSPPPGASKAIPFGQPARLP